MGFDNRLIIDCFANVDNIFIYTTAGHDSREKFQVWTCVKRKRKAVVSFINVLCLAKLGIHIFHEFN